jgi:alkylhydroperoxidase family enzyme
VAWIDAPREDEWDGPLADLYSSVVDKNYDRVDNIMQIHALNPDGMKAHSALYRSAMSGTKTLRKVEREMVALIVSGVNQCHY